MIDRRQRRNDRNTLLLGDAQDGCQFVFVHGADDQLRAGESAVGDECRDLRGIVRRVENVEPYRPAVAAEPVDAQQESLIEFGIAGIGAPASVRSFSAGGRTVSVSAGCSAVAGASAVGNLMIAPALSVADERPSLSSESVCSVVRLAWASEYIVSPGRTT